MRAQAIALFRAAFGTAPTHGASAPGRVNLLGEHTDYNGGPVLPFATQFRTAAVTGPGESGWVDLVSARDGVVQRVRLDAIAPPGWAAYVIGVMRELAARGAAPRGARLALASDVAVGAGLASSAALTVSVTRAFADLAGVELTPDDVISIAHRTEVRQVGVQCGIMDQTIAVRARAGNALLLECATGSTRYVPLGARLLLVDTGVRHELATNEYNTRRAECDAALATLRAADPSLSFLAEWPAEGLKGLGSLLGERLQSRVRHVVTETERTRAGAQLLARGRLKELGRLLFASHESCRRHYACSAPELDLVVRTAKRVGAWGARMTGAGWGGNVVILLGPARVAGTREAMIRKRVSEALAKRFGREPGIAALRAGAGSRRERVR